MEDLEDETHADKVAAVNSLAQELGVSTHDMGDM